MARMFFFLLPLNKGVGARRKKQPLCTKLASNVLYYFNQTVYWSVQGCLKSSFLCVPYQYFGYWGLPVYSSVVYSFHRFSKIWNFVSCFLGGASTVAITIVEVPLHSLYQHHCHSHYCPNCCHLCNRHHNTPQALSLSGAIIRVVVRLNPLHLYTYCVRDYQP